MLSELCAALWALPCTSGSHPYASSSSTVPFIQLHVPVLWWYKSSIQYSKAAQWHRSDAEEQTFYTILFRRRRKFLSLLIAYSGSRWMLQPPEPRTHYFIYILCIYVLPIHKYSIWFNKLFWFGLDYTNSIDSAKSGGLRSTAVQNFSTTFY